MNRKVLLIEPNYKNKYPPMGLMKLATYYRMVGDDVRFYKGDMRSLAVDLICEDLINNLTILFPDTFWKDYYPVLFNFIRVGKYAILDEEPFFQEDEILDVVKLYRKKYKEKDYFKNPRFDKVGITTLFTFYWDITIDTINFAKQLCKTPEGVMVGGIMSSLLSDEVEAATGIKPFPGLLNHPGDIDEGNELIIDELPLDYSILEEIDYVYPANNAYFAYMTRGCVNRCAFCAVPKLEPTFCDYINLKKRIEYLVKEKICCCWTIMSWLLIVMTKSSMRSENVDLVVEQPMFLPTSTTLQSATYGNPTTKGHTLGKP